MTADRELDLDIASAVARIEQALSLDKDDSLRDLLLDRLLTCDVPRLRGHLDSYWIERLDKEKS